MPDTINPDEVEVLFRSVLSEDGAEIEGILSRFRIDIARLERDRPKVEGWIALLEDAFHADKGGGWSFLNLCNDRNGVQWTGMHSTMEHFVVLAAALGLARFVMPRAMWSMFPGQMPYVVFGPQALTSAKSSFTPEA